MTNTVLYSKKQKPLNGQLRKNGQKGATVLWNYALEGDQLNGHQFVRKYTFEEYKVDFICSELKLAIDVIRNSKISDNRKEHEKQLLLEKQGYKVLKYTDSEIISRIDDVVSDIFSVAENLADDYRNTMIPGKLIDA